MTLALSESQLALVRRVLAQHFPGREVLAFGSRAHRRGLEPWSDLDLAVLGDAPRWLRELIEADGVTLQTRLQRA